ncbi:hypothetical protein [Methylobacterium oxalidis]|uniref:hypothetical protein n=1 Tax=Methylobacterium oxalidis TaxID=944322 RepID=UPI0024E15B77|nr:hypothetical protein [Methylobacterium oxalidis]
MALKSKAARVMRPYAFDPTKLPAPGSDEAKAKFYAACTETDRLHRGVPNHPELKRDALTWWTRDSLTAALEAGEVLPAEFARLWLLAADREHRLLAVAVTTGVGALHALAFADDYPLPADTNANDMPQADPVFAAIREARAAHAAVEAWNDAYEAKGLEAVGSLAREEELTERQSRTCEVALATTPTTPEGRRALVTFADWQIELHERSDGSPQDGAHTIFDRAYSALAHAIRAERAEPARVFAAVPLDALFALADLYDGAARHFHVGAFWPETGDDSEHSGKNLVVNEGDRLSAMFDAIVEEIAKREPANEIEADQQGEWLMRKALAGGDWEKAAVIATKTPANVQRAFARSEAARLKARG